MQRSRLSAKIRDSEADLKFLVGRLAGRTPGPKLAARIEQLKEFIINDKKRLEEDDNKPCHE